ncbi:alpha/beta fold hydrolase [Actinomadura sp. 9N407]|uniref:alpha/beta fold hydrolase n=1 Tax=Actinomadura sp. 9N407 TaxID=3375154 RepID=UPI0037AF3A9F
MKGSLTIRPRHSLAALAGALALIVSAVTLGGGDVYAAESSHHRWTSKPTIVLVHGAWADSSGWNGVISRLQAEGHPVVAAGLPLRGVAADAAYLDGLLKTLNGPIVLVGHSYGAAVITNTAADPDVKALAYVSAVIPDQGESVFDLAGRYAGSLIGPDTIQTVPLPSGDADVYLRPVTFHRVFGADLPHQVAARLAVTQRPVTNGALNEPSGAPAWKRLPSWAVVSRGDNVIPVAAQRFMTGRAGSRTVEINGSHATLISHADAVAAVIRKAARATN